jgi:hypothetical protein
MCSFATRDAASFAAAQHALTIATTGLFGTPVPRPQQSSGLASLRPDGEAPAGVAANPPAGVDSIATAKPFTGGSA